MDDLARPVDQADENDTVEDAGGDDLSTPPSPTSLGDVPGTPSAEEPADEEMVVAAAAEQTEQGALFSADVPPAVPADAEEDERVTAFGGAPDDLEAIRMDLGAEDAVPDAGASPDEPEVEHAIGEGPAVTVVEGEPEAEMPLAEAAEADGALLPEVPAGADDEPEAVEALLDAEAEEGLLEKEPVDRTLSVPYFVYIGVWLIFTIAMVVVLRDAAVARTLDTEPAYPLFVLGGLVLTVLGPILSVVLWLVKRHRSDRGERVGLFASAVLRGSLATFAGVVLWMLGLLVLNYMKTGRLY